MLNLSTTTLLCVDCLNVNVAIKVIERCKRLCNFADIKLLTSLPTDYPHVEIMHLPSLIHYSIFMLKKAHEYVNTEHLLIVQRDGWILNPQVWKPEWIQYDYIAPLFNQCDIVGAGGFSFRSNALMRTVSSKFPDWDGSDESTKRLQTIAGQYEDGVISIGLRKQLMREGFKFAPIEVAMHFAQGGNPNNKYYTPHPFGFHGAWRGINQISGEVSPNIFVVDLPEPL